MAIEAPAAPTVPSLRKAFYSPAEVAELASVSPSTVLNYIKAGKLPAVRLSERLIRIPRKAVVRLLELDEARPVVRDRPHRRVDI
jgi:excisionase family DNA binding protein